ncbi:AAA family ATPase (plasmid) [Salinigranum rubrum]|uniref:AAA family ATPase n=1 Tax=Salinigranum rubrum TaxID=755307 RepID=A0A2I8VS18_9EURY|nr:AAA family ATPase [Salinigranum rubrum]AUV84703.1 AAA family ATPase [Salinigranum rubrum]
MKDDDIQDAIRDGATRAGEIAEHVGVTGSTARRYLKAAAEDANSLITRQTAPSGSGYVYGIQNQDTDTASEMPVFGDREYAWETWVPEADAGGYVETDGERSDIEALIDNRDATGQLPRFRLTGPPGTGKTTLATSIAAERQWPLITIQFTSAMRDSEIFGSPHIIGGESVWVDGPGVKALLCSQVRPVVVVLDEVNRAPFARKASLQSVLDHRAQATLQLRGGEVIEGDPQNLITVATMNEGSEYETYPIDPAEKRRHGNTWEVPFLGMVDVDREASLVADRTPVADEVAHGLVRIANDVRELALEDETSPVKKGIATSTLLEWARTAAAYRQSDRPDPVVRAARSAVLRPHYGDLAADEVEAVIVDGLSRVRAHAGAA